MADLGVEGRLEAILDEFPVDVSSTQVLDVPGLDDARLYEVDMDSGLMPEDMGVDACYILDSEAGMRVACHPHLVGAELAAEYPRVRAGLYDEAAKAEGPGPPLRERALATVKGLFIHHKPESARPAPEEREQMGAEE